MAGKTGNMFLFVLGLVVLAPIGLVSGFLALAWAWESIAGCFFSLSYSCGQVQWFKAFLFGAVAYGCLTIVKNLWDKTK